MIVTNALDIDSFLAQTGTTIFIYSIEGKPLDPKQLISISDSQIENRINKIFLFGKRIIFERCENRAFENSLILIDTLLPQILSEIVLSFYSSELVTLRDFVGELSKNNPIGYNQDNDHPYYEYKIKRFLTDIALAMMPSKVCSGKLDANGDYLIEKEDGDVLCYHIYNRNDFEDYLLSNTKLETASSSRHDFGKVYTENGKQLINLNLQIRFKK
mgnify:CR=1 FL=1